MKTNSPMSNRKVYGQRDTLESDTDTSLRGFGSSLVKNVGNSFADIGGGIFDQLTGQFTENGHNGQEQSHHNESNVSAHKIETRTLFNFREQEERQQIEAMKELIKQIKAEVDMIKKQDIALMNEVKDIEKLTLESAPLKVGLYHIRFLEVVLKMLQALRSKIGESSTWMQALMSKKKKRGSLFASRSKSQGTQYSLSQEMQASRSVQ